MDSSHFSLFDPGVSIVDNSPVIVRNTYGLTSQLTITSLLGYAIQVHFTRSTSCVITQHYSCISPLWQLLVTVVMIHIISSCSTSLLIFDIEPTFA